MNYNLNMGDSSNAESLANDLRKRTHAMEVDFKPGSQEVTLIFPDPSEYPRSWTGPLSVPLLPAYRRDEAVNWLYSKGARSFPPKQHFKAHQHNGTTVYETTDNREAWAKRNAEYIDSLNTGPDAPRPRAGWAAPAAFLLWNEKRLERLRSKS